MDAAIEVSPLDVVKKKFKKRKNTESGVVADEDGKLQAEDKGNGNKGKDFVGSTSAFRADADTDVVSSLDMDCNSKKEKKDKDRSRKETKEKDRSRKETKEKDRSKKEKKTKDTSGFDMNDQVSNHKTDKKKKKSQMGDEGRVSDVLEALDKDIHAESDCTRSSELKTRKKEKILAKDRKNMNGKNTDIKANGVVAGDSVQLMEVQEQVQQGGQSKKKKNKDKKELKRKEAEAGEKNYGGHDSVQNQDQSDNKRKKKRRAVDLGAEHDSHVHSVGHEEDSGVSGSKKMGKSGRSKIGPDPNLVASVSNEGAHEKKKKKKDKEDDSSLPSNEGAREKKKKKKKDKKDDSSLPSNEGAREKKKKKKKKDKKDDSSLPSNEGNSRVGGTKKNKEKSNTERDASTSSLKTKKRKKVPETSERSASSKKSKKVRFSDQNEFFSLPDDLQAVGERNTSFDGLIRGKRFSKEEDELVKKAVFNYIETNQLGENGMNMVMKCGQHPELKGCWKEIGESLPWRPYMSVYDRAHALFERDENRKWTQEELDTLKKHHEKHGSDWKTLSDELGKYRRHLKDQWRRIKLPNRKMGNWSQDEYQSLFDLVNLDISMKVFQEKKSQHGMLRDNISWEAISEKLETRNTPTCCIKWYQQLSSSLVAEGKWSDVDDYRLLIALVDLDAACEEEVEWDCLIDHRSGEICRKRWRQMVLHIGEYGVKPFSEQVDVLSRRYCPNLLEPRETYADKPYVD